MSICGKRRTATRRFGESSSRLLRCQGRTGVWSAHKKIRKGAWRRPSGLTSPPGIFSGQQPVCGATPLYLATTENIGTWRSRLWQSLPVVRILRFEGDNRSWLHPAGVDLCSREHRPRLAAICNSFSSPWRGGSASQVAALQAAIACGEQRPGVVAPGYEVPPHWGEEAEEQDCYLTHLNRTSSPLAAPAPGSESGSFRQVGSISCND